MAAKIPGNGVESSGAFTVGAAGTASSLAGIPFFSDTTNGSIYTHDVSGTDDTAADNTAFGLNALDAITTGDYNVAIGKNALSANNTGHSNVAVGAGSQLSMTSGNTNTSVGNNALYSCTVGDRNTAVGANAFYALEPSSNSDMENVAIGFSAGRFNTTGDYNTFLGAQAGYSVTTGGQNTLIGRFAGGNFDTENHNLAIGRNALGGSVAGGEYNVAIGNYSGDALTSGDNNTYIGYNSAPTSTTAYLNVFIGKDAGTNNITGNNNVVIGAEAQTYDSDDFNQINIGHANPGIASNIVSLGIASTNQIYATFTSSASWTKSSDERIKKNITTNTKAGLDFINELRTVTFNKKRVTEFDPSMELYKATEDESDKLAYYDGTLYGLIAQEVKTAMDKHGISDFDGWHEKPKGDKIQGIAESQFVIPLIKAVQELAAKVKALEEA